MERERGCRGSEEGEGKYVVIHTAKPHHNNTISYHLPPHAKL
jgi:hypothetical protein